MTTALCAVSQLVDVRVFLIILCAVSQRVDALVFLTASRAVIIQKLTHGKPSRTVRRSGEAGGEI